MLDCVWPLKSPNENSPHVNTNEVRRMILNYQNSDYCYQQEVLSLCLRLFTCPSIYRDFSRCLALVSLKLSSLLTILTMKTTLRWAIKNLSFGKEVWGVLREKCSYSYLFWLNTERYSVQIQWNTDQKNSAYGHFSSSGTSGFSR